MEGHENTSSTTSGIERQESHENSSVSSDAASKFTSTPFVGPKTSQLTNPLDGSLFDHSTQQTSEGHNSSCDMSSIAELTTTSDDMSASRVNPSPLVTNARETSGSCDEQPSVLDKGFCTTTSLTDTSQGPSEPPTLPLEDTHNSSVMQPDEEQSVSSISPPPPVPASSSQPTDLPPIDAPSVETPLAEPLETPPAESLEAPLAEPLETPPAEPLEAPPAEALNVSKNSSIYLHGTDTSNREPTKKTAKPQRSRLTMAERATLESLASFGGTGLGSVLQKAETLKDRLEKDKEKFKQPKALVGEEAELSKRSHKDDEGEEEGKPARKRTRLETSIAKSQELFHGVPLGGSIEEEQHTKSSPPANDSNSTRPPVSETAPARRMTRLEKARLEALNSFGGHGFHTVLSTATKKVSRTLAKDGKRKSQDTEAENDKEKENSEQMMEEGVATE